MAKANNVSSVMDDKKKEIIRQSKYNFRNALEVSAYLIETGEFEKFFKLMQIADLQKEIDEMD